MKINNDNITLMNFKALKFKHGTYSRVKDCCQNMPMLENLAKDYDVIFRMQGITDGYYANVGRVMMVTVKPLKEKLNFFQKYILNPKEEMIYPPNPFTGNTRIPRITTVVQVLIDSLKDRGY